MVTGPPAGWLDRLPHRLRNVPQGTLAPSAGGALTLGSVRVLPPRGNRNQGPRAVADGAIGMRPAGRTCQPCNPMSDLWGKTGLVPARVLGANRA
jgi:hypothetical protein